MGDEVTTSGHDVAPVLSPDGQFIFFNKDEDIYWVNSILIEDLKPEELR